LVEVVAEDAVIERASLLVGQLLEVDAVKVLERRQLIAVEAGSPSVIEIMLGFGPPVAELLARLPRRERVVPGIVAVPPDAVEVHPLALVGFDIAGQLVERPKMVMRVDGGDGVEVFLDAAVGIRVAGASQHDSRSQNKKSRCR